MSDPELKGLVEDILSKYISFLDEGVLGGIIQEVVLKEYVKGLDEAGITFNMNFLPNQETLGFIQRFSFDNVKGLKNDLMESLRKELSMALLNQESVPGIKQRIKGVMDVGVERAELIARTESVRAFNMGHFQGAKESGLVTVKEWNAQPEKNDLNPCPLCKALDGKTVGMDDKFSDDDGVYFLPPRHPRCKCRVIYKQESKKKSMKSYVMESLPGNKIRVVEYDS
jgi:SPP1 gp7 family putative phage head morphogenesis protein